MKAQEIIDELRSLGGESTKKVLMRHGACEPFYGVKVEDLKKIQKRIKKNQALALELYASGISDAMYLAGLIADPKAMKKAELQKWVEQAYWYMLSDYTVAWCASESPFGRELALRWMDSPMELIASSGWATYSSLMAIRPDGDLDLEEIEGLLERVERQIHSAVNRVKYSMNGFVIATGCYVRPLHERALQTARVIGPVDVEMGGTSCKTPLATDAIAKVAQRGTVGKKRKQAAC